MEVVCLQTTHAAEAQGHHQPPPPRPPAAALAAVTYGGPIKPPALAWRQQHSPPPVKSVSPAHAHAWMRYSILSNGRRSAGLQQLKHFDWLPDVRPRRDKSRSNVHYGHILMYSMKLFCCGAGGGGAAS